MDTKSFTFTMQVTPETITFNRMTLGDIIRQAVKEGVEEASKKKEDPLEMVTLVDLAKKFDCSIRTISRRTQVANVKTFKQGIRVCIFRKDVDKFLKQY